MLLDAVFRFRVLIAAFSIAVSVFLFGFACLCYVPWSAGWLRVVDLAFWVLSIGSMFAGFAEFRLFWRRCPALSTLLIDVVGLGVVVFARFSSAIYSLLKTSFYVQIVGGSIVDDVSYKLASLAVLGSFMIYSSTSLSTWFKKPVVFVEGLTLHEVFLRLIKVLSAVDARWVYIASFAVGFLTRLYPELKYLNLPIGWDTLEYISNARDFAYQPKALTTYIWMGWWRNLPPLLTWVPGTLSLAGVDPWAFFKVYPPLVVGAISALSAAIAYRLAGSKPAAIAAALLAVFNPYILGQSQQWQRHVLGVALLLAYLYLCEAGAGPLSRALTLLAASLSYEPAAVVALLLSAAEAATSRGRLGRCVFTLSTALSLMALLWYVGFPQAPVVALTPEGVYVAGNIEYYPGSALRYTITCLLLLAPSLAATAVWGRISWRARLAILLLLAAFAMPVLSVVAPVDQHRWFTMLLTVLTPYTAAGLARLGIRPLTAVALTVVALGSAYPLTDYGYEHFRIWSSVSTQHASGYPWRMAPAISDLTDVERAAELVAGFGGPALVRLSLYPQLHLYIRNPTNLVAEGQDPTLPTAISYAASNNLSKLLVVTAENLSKQLEEFKEEPDLYNVTMSHYLSMMRRYVSIDSVECEALYVGRTLAVYVVNIGKNSQQLR